MLLHSIWVHTSQIEISRSQGFWAYVLGKESFIFVIRLPQCALVTQMPWHLVGRKCQGEWWGAYFRNSWHKTDVRREGLVSFARLRMATLGLTFALFSKIRTLIVFSLIIPFSSSSWTCTTCRAATGQRRSMAVGCLQRGNSPSHFKASGSPLLDRARLFWELLYQQGQG